MFFRLLDTLRTKPKAQRQRYAFTGAVIVTGMVFAVWLASIPGRVAELNERLVEGSGDVQVASAPFSGFWQRIKAQFSSVSNATTTNSVSNSDTDVTRIVSDFTTSTPDTYNTNSATTTELPSGSVITFGTASTSGSESAPVVLVGTSSIAQPIE
jgi:hypothetical protein